MTVHLRLPGANTFYPLPPSWTDAEFRFAWNAARQEREELRIELEVDGSMTYLVMYPSEVSWYELRGAPIVP